MRRFENEIDDRIVNDDKSYLCTTKKQQQQQVHPHRQYKYKYEARKRAREQINAAINKSRQHDMKRRFHHCLIIIISVGIIVSSFQSLRRLSYDKDLQSFVELATIATVAVTSTSTLPNGYINESKRDTVAVVDKTINDNLLSNDDPRVTTYTDIRTLINDPVQYQEKVNNSGQEVVEYDSKNIIYSKSQQNLLVRDTAADAIVAAEQLKNSNILSNKNIVEKNSKRDQQQEHLPRLQRIENESQSSDSFLLPTPSDMTTTTRTSTTYQESNLQKVVDSQLDKEKIQISTSIDNQTSMKSVSNTADPTLTNPTTTTHAVSTTTISNTPAIQNIAELIPIEFISDRKYFSQDTNRKRQSFPRWEIPVTTIPFTISDIENPTTLIVQNVSIMESMINFIDTLIPWYNTIPSNVSVLTKDSYTALIRLTDHDNDAMWWNPETLYILTGAQKSQTEKNVKLLVSEKQRNSHYKVERRNKIEIMEQLMVDSIKVFKNSYHSNQNRWNRLIDVLITKNSSIPFIVWYGDYTGCNAGNWKWNNNGQVTSVLLFTVAGNVNCYNTMPFPNFQLYKDSFASSTDWIVQQQLYQRRYKSVWVEKIPKLVWRGSLTGTLPKNESERCVRYQLTKLVHSSTSVLNDNERSLFDIKLTGMPSLYRKGSAPETIDTSILGGIHSNTEMKMEEYQNHRAILDMDGHSWSSRFGTLLCYNSVILKIDPTYVDYIFYKFKSNDTNKGSNENNDNQVLLPWVHYIPIKKDLSDLITKTKYALDDKNSEHMEQIIANANKWCQNNMIYTQIQLDLLDLLEQYVQILDKSSSYAAANTGSTVTTWEQHWDNTKSKVIDSSLQMTHVEPLLPKYLKIRKIPK